MMLKFPVAIFNSGVNSRKVSIVRIVEKFGAGFSLIP